MKLAEKIVSSKTIYSGKVVRLAVKEVCLPDGRKAKREVVHHSGGVVILATEDDQVLLVEQYRTPVLGKLLEVPAGKLDRDESPLIAAKRELREETGYEAKHWEKLISFYTSPGFSDEILHLYSAKGLRFVGTDPDDTEFIKSKFVPGGELKKMLAAGAINDAKTLIALAYLIDFGS